ncbi:hypothetical protein H5410_003613, partial [Solanum commersonii]
MLEAAFVGEFPLQLVSFMIVQWMLPPVLLVKCNTDGATSGVKIKDNINLVAKVGASREVQILDEVLGDPMVYFNVDRCITSIMRSITARVQHSLRKEVVTFRQNELSKSKESHDLGFAQI